MIAMPTPDYGQPGDPIPGSKYVRDYCLYCGEAIRVVDASQLNMCRSCAGPPASTIGNRFGYLTPRQREALQDEDPTE